VVVANLVLHPLVRNAPTVAIQTAPNAVLLGENAVDVGLQIVANVRMN